MAQLPMNRTRLNAAIANQQPSIIAASQANREAHIEAADTLDLLYSYTSGLVAGGNLQPYPHGLNRQALINGNFDIAQQGVSWTNPLNNAYTLDMWQVSWSADGGVMPSTFHDRVSQPSGLVPSSRYAYRTGWDGAGSGFGANAYYSKAQKIEHGTRYLCGSGKKITISLSVRKNTIAGTKRIGIAAIQKYGSGGSPSSPDILSGSVFTLGTTQQTIALTLNTATLEGKTFGTNNDDSIDIVIYEMWGSTVGSTYLGGASAETFVGVGNVDIMQVQVCTGDAALPFQPRSAADELVLCQRYFEKSYSHDITPGTVSNLGLEVKIVPNNTIASLQPYGSVIFKVRKRATPTVTIYPTATPTNTGRVSDYTTGADLAAGSGTVNFLNDKGFNVYNGSGASATTSSNAITFHWTADSRL